jgi:hypothetical protein
MAEWRESFVKELSSFLTEFRGKIVRKKGGRRNSEAMWAAIGGMKKWIRI